MSFLTISQFLEQWIHAHPHWLFLSILVVSAFESLAIIGMIVPGIVILFGAGALAGKGYLNLEAALGAAWIGAFIGDASSFLIGHHFHAHIREWFLFKKHKNWIDKGERFFLKHGGLSVFIGRFAGPVRAVLPLVAGMMGMSTLRFIGIDIVAGILWSIVYLLPGYLVGASMHWSELISREFILTVILIVVASWVISYLCSYILYKSNKPVIGYIKKAIYISGLFFIAISVLDKSGLLTTVKQWFAFEVLHGETLLTGKISVMITLLGSNTVQALWAVVLFLSMWLHKNRKSALTFGFSMIALVLALAAIKWAFNMHRPPNMLDKINYSFPSGHVTLTTFLAFAAAKRIATALKERARFMIWGVAVFLSATVAMSRMFLNMHWITDVCGAFALGFLAYCFWLYLEEVTWPAKPMKNPIALILVLFAVSIVPMVFIYPYMVTRYLGLGG